MTFLLMLGVLAALIVSAEKVFKKRLDQRLTAYVAERYPGYDSFKCVSSMALWGFNPGMKREQTLWSHELHVICGGETITEHVFTGDAYSNWPLLSYPFLFLRNR